MVNKHYSDNQKIIVLSNLYGTNPSKIKEISKNKYLVNGDVSLYDLNDNFHFELESKYYDTLSGILIENLGYIPEDNENIEPITINGVIFKPQRVRNKKIEKVVMTFDKEKLEEEKMKKDIRKTNIVCTIGPASEFRIKELIEAGMGVARINFSHGGKEEQQEKVERIKKIREEMGVPLAIMLDTQGPEIRLGRFSKDIDEKQHITEGMEIILTNDDRLADGKYFAISYKELWKDVKPGSTILIDDGALILKVEKIENEQIFCKAVNNAILKERKSINVPGAILRLPALKEKDINDLLYGIEAGFDYIAASFIRNENDIKAIRDLLKENGGERIKIIAKIENQEGIENIESIINAADGVMVARGDLAVEIPFEEAPFYQKQMIKIAKRLGKPVIVATQMLESMSSNPNPTRAEVSDVANAVYDVTSAVMLSGETAAGKYPVECVKAMDKIARNAEQHINYAKRLRLDEREYNTLDEKIAEITVSTAHKIGADAIVTYTKTGRSVETLAGFGAVCPILAITDDKKTYNQLALIWNVTPLLVESKETITKTIENGIHEFKENGIVEDGDLLYLAGGREYIKGVKESKRIGGIVIA